MIDNFSTIGYVSRYSCPDTIHDTICYITTKQEGYCYGMVYFYHKCHLVSCLWAQKSVNNNNKIIYRALNPLIVQSTLQFSNNKITRYTNIKKKPTCGLV